MKTCLFRYAGRHGIGFAQGRDLTELFWAIDEVTDPYQVEICWLIGKHKDFSLFFDMNDQRDITNVEVGEAVAPEVYEPNEFGKWIKLDWQGVRK